MEANHLVYGIHINNRIRDAGAVQQVLTQYGCNIKTRIGLHRVDEKVCSTEGLLILEMYGDEQTCHEMADRLSALHGVEVQKMFFTHPTD